MQCEPIVIPKFPNLSGSVNGTLTFSGKGLVHRKKRSPFSTDWPLKVFVSKPTSTRSYQSVGKGKNYKWRTSIQLELFFRSKHAARIIFP